MAGFISFPALQPEFQRLWTLSDSEAEFISGIYFAGYVIAVPLVSGLTDRLVSAALWRFVQGAAFGGSYMPGLRTLSEAVPAQRQGTAIAVFTARFTVRTTPNWHDRNAILALGPKIATARKWRNDPRAYIAHRHQTDTKSTVAVCRSGWIKNRFRVNI